MPPKSSSAKKQSAKDDEFDALLKAEQEKHHSQPTASKSSEKKKAGPQTAAGATTATSRTAPANKRSFVFLYDSVTTAQAAPATAEEDEGQGKKLKDSSSASESAPSQRRFYPGAPRWLEMDPEAFAAALALESAESPSAAAIAQARKIVTFQRSLDQCHRLLPSAYEGLGKKRKLSMADHQEVYHKCGLDLTTSVSGETTVTLEQIELKEVPFEVQVGAYAPSIPQPAPRCEYCGEESTDPRDPPECVCGEVYCSDACHAADWPAHEKTCLAIEAAQRGSLGMTDSYWALVLKGYFPLKSEPDFVAMWQEKKEEDAQLQALSPALQATQELLFYTTTEKKFMAAELGPSQSKLGRPKDTEQEQANALADFQSIVMKQIVRMTSPLASRDSHVRLSWKLNMCEQFHRMSSIPGVTIASRADLEAKFLPLIKEKQHDAQAATKE